jgi:hypothetical protein
MACGKEDHGVTGVLPVGDMGITKLMVRPLCTILQYRFCVVGVGTAVVQVVSSWAVELETPGKVNKATRSTELAATPFVTLQEARLAAQGLRFCSKT